MSSAKEERSLASGIPIPQWMRNKTDNYGFDPSTLSPPMHEGDFFYIKFPRPQPAEQSNLRSLNEVLEVKEKAFVKHTEPCKQFIPKIQDTVQVQKPKVLKPMGVDDGFKGEGAACGVSVVEVAHQMLTKKNKSFKTLMRGETEGSLSPPSSYLQKRRDSKSLPASPTTSPVSSPLARRKNNQNLFGGNYVNIENLNESDENINKTSGSSWILSSLFSASQKNENEKESRDEKNLVLANPTSKKIVKHQDDASNAIKNPVNVAVEIKTISPSPASTTNKASIFKSKPHLRDLNLLTPSSM